MNNGGKSLPPLFVSALSGYYLLYLVELVQGLDRRKIVDVEVQNLVANLRQDGVVELEEAQLHALAVLRHLLHVGFLDGRAHIGIVGLEFLQHRIGPLDNRPRHTCNLGNMDTKAMF